MKQFLRKNSRERPALAQSLGGSGGVRGSAASGQRNRGFCSGNPGNASAWPGVEVGVCTPGQSSGYPATKSQEPGQVGPEGRKEECREETTDQTRSQSAEHQQHSAPDSDPAPPSQERTFRAIGPECPSLPEGRGAGLK